MEVLPTAPGHYLTRQASRLLHLGCLQSPQTKTYGMLTQSKQTPKTGVACRVPGRAASKTASRMFKKGRKPSLSSAQNCLGGQSALLVGLGQPTLRTTSSRCSRLLQPPPQPPRAPRQAKERSQNIRSMPKAPSIQSTQGADRAKTKLKVKATHALQILMRYQRPGGLRRNQVLSAIRSSEKKR